MAEKKGKKQKKKSNAKKGNFPVVIILVVLGVALAIGLYSYVFQRDGLSPYSRFRASHSEVRYPDGYSVRGIDISRYQGTIDWQQVKDDMIGGSTIQFVFIKATEGVTIFDPHFNDNFYTPWGIPFLHTFRKWRKASGSFFATSPFGRR